MTDSLPPDGSRPIDPWKAVKTYDYYVYGDGYAEWTGYDNDPESYLRGDWMKTEDVDKALAVERQQLAEAREGERQQIARLQAELAAERREHEETQHQCSELSTAKAEIIARLEAEIAEAREACPSVRMQDHCDKPLLALVNLEVSRGFNRDAEIIKLQHQVLHDADDDSPYDVDGVIYCGRCHMAIDVIVKAIEALRENGGTQVKQGLAASIAMTLRSMNATREALIQRAESAEGDARCYADAAKFQRERAEQAEAELAEAQHQVETLSAENERINELTKARLTAVAVPSVTPKDQVRGDAMSDITETLRPFAERLAEAVTALDHFRYARRWTPEDGRTLHAIYWVLRDAAAALVSDQPEYTSGATEGPEFDEWWQEFGPAVEQAQQPQMIAMAGWSAARTRASQILRHHVETLSAAQAQLQQELAEARAALPELRKELSDGQRLIEERDGARLAYRGFADRLEQAEAEVARLTAEKQQLEAAYRAVEARIPYANEYDDMEARVARLTAERDALQQQVQDLTETR